MSTVLTQEQFGQAIETLLANDQTRTALLEKLNEVIPGNAEIELALTYETNDKFRSWLNNHIWQQVR